MFFVNDILKSESGNIKFTNYRHLLGLEKYMTTVQVCQVGWELCKSWDEDRQLTIVRHHMFHCLIVLIDPKRWTDKTLCPSDFAPF